MDSKKFGEVLREAGYPQRTDVSAPYAVLYVDDVIEFSGKVLAQARKHGPEVEDEMDAAIKNAGSRMVQDGSEFFWRVSFPTVRYDRAD